MSRNKDNSSQSEGIRTVNQVGAGDFPDDPHDPRLRIWQVVSMIPAGKVASYGQVARLAGMPRHARLVGKTLSNLPKGSKLPWFRVVQASRKLAPRGGGEARQRSLLEAEGITFVGARVARAHLWDADVS